MKTITHQQFADLTVAFLSSDLTDSDSAMVLAELTHDMLSDNDKKEFMNLVADGAVAMLTEKLKGLLK